jgi:hypothetical protein
MADRGAPSDANDLGDFLRARRAALDPRRAGLPDDGRLRRVSGLRREELSQLANALLTDFGALPAAERNLTRLMFLADAFRSLYADWPRAARDCVAVLRMEAGQHPDDPELIALVGALSIRDADFRTWWTSHPVHGLGPVTRTFHHPVVGTLTLDIHQLSVGTHPDLLLVAYTAPPDSGSREALRVLLHSFSGTTDPEEDAATDPSGHH